MREYLSFEKPVVSIEDKIEELKCLAKTEHSINITKEIETLEKKVQKTLTKIYKKLTPWEIMQVAKHNDRPQFLDYLQNIFENFIGLSGDRVFSEDHSIIGGLASFNSKTVMVIGQQRGNSTETRIKYNFGMPKPEGYRKVQRLLKLADYYQIPVITFIDTQGAYPGIDSEARGIGEAIAKSIQMCLRVSTPIISVVIGEGYSGGAIAIGTCDRMLMLEYSVFSVISPAGCASILWKDINQQKQAAEALKITSQDLLKLNLIDEIIQEPLGGAHRNHEVTMKNVENAISKHLKELSKIPKSKIIERRLDKYLQIA